MQQKGKMKKIPIYLMCFLIAEKNQLASQGMDEVLHASGPGMKC